MYELPGPALIEFHTCSFYSISTRVRIQGRPILREPILHFVQLALQDNQSILRLGRCRCFALQLLQGHIVLCLQIIKIF